MSNTALIVVIAGGVVATYMTRLSFIRLIPEDKLPAGIRSSLKYVAPAVLAALILPDLVLQAGQLNLTLTNPRLIAGIIAALAAWRGRRTWLTISAGMVSLWILNAL